MPPESGNAAAPGVQGQASIRGSSIIAALKRSGIEFVCALPDLTTSEGVLRPLATDPDLRLLRVCREDEGIGICAGLSYCNRRGVLLMQHTGLLDSINAMRTPAVEYGLPICMIVGLLEKEEAVPPKESKRYGVRIVEPILDAMGITHHLLETEADVAKIQPALEQAFQNSSPLVLLIGRRPLAS